MRKNKMIIILSLFFMLASCRQTTENFLNTKPTRTVYGNEQGTIVLQNPANRVIATCYSSTDVSAETCAKIFESKAYVRLTNIPYKTANYDKLRTDTYPTRRWRGNEHTPRW